MENQFEIVSVVYGQTNQSYQIYRLNKTTGQTWILAGRRWSEIEEPAKNTD
jgi:hypothetical protein